MMKNIQHLNPGSVRVVQGTISPGFGGLEMVIIEFHEWLLSQNIEAYVLAVKDTPLEKTLRQRGHKETLFTVPSHKTKEIIEIRKRFDSPETAMVFHRQQGLKVLRFQNLQSKVSLISHTFYGVQKRDFWHRWLFNKVDRWIVLTEKHKQNLIETCAIDESKIQIIPNGVDLKRFRPKFKPCPSTKQVVNLGIIARLDPKKGQDLAIEALHLLQKNKDFEWRLNFFGNDTPGEPPIRPRLERMANDLGVASQVVFHGHLVNVHEAISQLDLLWMPSEKETFGRCILESMAAGVPVIASNAGGVPDIIETDRNGILFETLDAEDLAQKTLRLLQNPSLFQEIQFNARKDVEHRFDQQIVWPQLFAAIAPENHFNKKDLQKLALA